MRGMFEIQIFPFFIRRFQFLYEIRKWKRIEGKKNRKGKKNLNLKLKKDRKIITFNNMILKIRI